LAPLDKDQTLHSLNKNIDYRYVGIDYIKVFKAKKYILISADVKKGTHKKIQEAEALNVHVVPEAFLEKVKGLTTDDALRLVKEMAISTWGDDVSSYCSVFILVTVIRIKEKDSFFKEREVLLPKTMQKILLYQNYK
jgi:hypothetical protein